MVSLHGFSILILLTQSIHKSALLFSCTRPFSGACGYYTLYKRKSQTYVHIFLRKVKQFFGVIHKPKEKERDNRQNYAVTLQQKPARRDEKGDPQAGQRGRLFAAGFAVRAFFLCFARLFGKGHFSMTNELVFSLAGFRRELVCGGAKRRRTRL